ncbi:MAG: gliding motility protein GldL [Bacteroidales bacterium]|nr:gliding motility protein GldL [Bacteroidales bacterium]
MGITEIVQSSGWKSFTAKLYGFGASIVIIGALFKIQHWPGAGVALSSGLIIESIIFFFSAFEPLHEELDWTLVYPELAGMSDPDEIDEYKEQAIADRNVGLQKFDELFEQSQINAEDVRSLGNHLNTISTTTETIGDITSASLATKEYFDKMGVAAEKMDNVATAYGTNTGELNESVNTLAESYKNTASMIDSKGKDIADKFATSSANLTATYEAMSGEVKEEHTNISQSQKQFNDQLATLNKNLSELNTSYADQVKGSQDHLQGTAGVYKGLNEMITSLQISVEETQKYKSEIVKLSESLSELNNVYGNMLTAMSIRKK